MNLRVSWLALSVAISLLNFACIAPPRFSNSKTISPANKKNLNVVKPVNIQSPITGDKCTNEVLSHFAPQGKEISLEDLKTGTYQYLGSEVLLASETKDAKSIVELYGVDEAGSDGTMTSSLKCQTLRLADGEVFSSTIDEAIHRVHHNYIVNDDGSREKRGFRELKFQVGIQSNEFELGSRSFTDGFNQIQTSSEAHEEALALSSKDSTRKIYLFDTEDVVYIDRVVKKDGDVTHLLYSLMRYKRVVPAVGR
jgi:hypothetical protein